MRRQLEEYAWDTETALVFFDGFDDAILGLVEHFGEHGRCERVLYDREKCVQILMAKTGGDYDMAAEHFEFNVADAYVGPATPAFLSTRISPFTHEELHP